MHDPNSHMEMYPVGRGNEEKMEYRPPPHGGGDMGRFQANPKDEKAGYALIKYFFFTYNLFFFLCGSTLFGVGVWIAVDRSYMATIMGNPLYAVAAYIIIAGSIIMFIIGFLGCCGAMTNNKTMLKIFFVTLLVIFLILLVAGILAFVFRTQLGDAIQGEMRDSLRDNYGVDLHERWNRAVTDAWDKAQEKLHCCAVDDMGWGLYHESKWFAQQVWTAEEQRPYVPRTCCLRDRFERYYDNEICQRWRLGPPGYIHGGAVNMVLYYNGCYTAGTDFVLENSTILGCLAIIIALIMLVGIIVSFYLIRKIDKMY